MQHAVITALSRRNLCQTLAQGQYACIVKYISKSSVPMVQPCSSAAPATLKAAPLCLCLLLYWQVPNRATHLFVEQRQLN
jgi:hypothetical protein